MTLNELHVCTQNQLEKVHFKYERLNLNDPFQQLNEPYSQNLAPPPRSVSSKSSDYLNLNPVQVAPVLVEKNSQSRVISRSTKNQSWKKVREIKVTSETIQATTRT